MHYKICLCYNGSDKYYLYYKICLCYNSSDKYYLNINGIYEISLLVSL